MNPTLPGCIGYYGAPLPPNKCEGCKHVDLCKRTANAVRGPAIKVIEDYTADGGDVLACPVCGFECVHPLRVTVATGLDTTIVDATGTHVLRMKTLVTSLRAAELDDTKTQAAEVITAESLTAHRERGVRIIVEYRCEYGHHGNIILQFHKGNTCVEHEVLEPLSEYETLWRT